MDNYSNYSDEQLIGLLRDGDTRVVDHLLEKYKYLVRKKANTLFLLGGDTDDLIQEGMIGLFKAIRDYKEGQGNFFTFADLCISRQIYTAIDSASRKKHGPLNSAVSISQDGEENGQSMDHTLGAREMDPEQIMIDKENVNQLMHQIREQLSKMECQVLEYYLEGINYRQIAVQMNRSEKSIDNALQRIRAKVQRLIVE